MRLLPSIIYRNCKFKSLFYNLSRRYNVDNLKHETVPVEATVHANLVEISPSWNENEESELRSAVVRDMRVLPEFISVEEEAALLAELEPRLKRMRYEYDHWDDAIQGYRETERSSWSPANEAVLRRVRAVAFEPGDRPLPHVHVLDLASTGFIKPHVDATRFCGDVIAGLCLVSSAVMRLQHAAPARAHLALHALLPRRALYIMRDVARYEFTHAVLGGADSVWRGDRVPRGRRISIICRSRPAPAGDSSGTGDAGAGAPPSGYTTRSS